MDTALRRRFHFEEMMPDSSVIKGLTITEGEESVDVAKILDVINERIEYLYDREHTIGHAFFTSLLESPSLDGLSEVFRTKVVPLLQEYFYEDYEKIQLVLGDNYKSSDEYKFILDSSIDERTIFKGTPDIDLKEKKYTIQNEAFYKIQSYIEIVETR
jgi:5-methylcytosine-specific restriction endonuclease McrBC GTP-binding regulatory subunit McrB